MICGIDPGKTGALVVIGEQGELRGYQIMPIITVHDKPTVDAQAVMEWLAHYDIDQVCIERVHSISGQGIVSSFTFGKVAGMVEAAVQCAGLPYSFVTPQKWKACFDYVGKDKDAPRLALLDAGLDDVFKLKGKGQAVADAYHIAMWRFLNAAE